MTVRLDQLAMRHIARLFTTLVRDCKGATAVEYGLIAALVTIAAMASINGVAAVTKIMFAKVETSYRTSTGQ